MLTVVAKINIYSVFCKEGKPTSITDHNASVKGALELLPIWKKLSKTSIHAKSKVSWEMFLNQME